MRSNVAKEINSMVPGSEPTHGGSKKVLGTLDGKVPQKKEKSLVVHHGANAKAASRQKGDPGRPSRPARRQVTPAGLRPLKRRNYIVATGSLSVTITIPSLNGVGQHAADTFGASNVLTTTLLQQVAQQVGSSGPAAGNIVYPPGSATVVGTWTYTAAT